MLNSIFGEKEGRIKKDTQKHIMKCPVIKTKVTNRENITYKDLKSGILTEQIDLVKQLGINYKNRETLMNEATNM